MALLTYLAEKWQHGIHIRSWAGRSWYVNVLAIMKVFPLVMVMTVSRTSADHSDVLQVIISWGPLTSYMSNHFCKQLDSRKISSDSLPTFMEIKGKSTHQLSIWNIYSLPETLCLQGFQTYDFHWHQVTFDLYKQQQKLSTHQELLCKYSKWGSSSMWHF